MLPPPLSCQNNDDDDGFNDEDGPQRRWKCEEDAAEGLISYLGHMFGAAFISASEKIGMPVRQQRDKMDAPTAAAMWEDAGVYLHSQRVIHRYYINEFGHKFTVPESELRQLASERVLPITGSTKVGEEELSWWYKDPLQVITTKVEKLVRHDKLLNIERPFNKLDIIIGGDHGQKSFRMSVKVILKRDKNEKVEEFIANIGEVECRKDTAIVLRNTILSHINERLKVMINYRRDANGDIQSDGTLFAIKKPSLEEYFSFEKPTDPLEVLMVEKSVDLRILVTGDLAFYATVLGMEGASSSACWLCLLKKKEWEAKPYAKGEKRTMAWISNNAPTGTTSTSSTRANGMKEKPLFDAIETCRYIVPPLHTMLGVGNGLLANFKEFVDDLLENTPEDLQVLRLNEMQAGKEWSEAKMDVDEWASLNGPEMASCIQAQKDIKDILEHEADYPLASEQEIKDLNAEIPILTLRIKALKNAQKMLLDIVKGKAKVWAASRKLAKDYCRHHKYDKPVKSKVERVLRKHGIDYAAYHGGDLVGNDCRKLMGSAPQICQDLEEVLLSVADGRGMSVATKSAITDRCHAFCHALVCFDAVFSFMFTPNERVDMEVDLPRLEEWLRKALTAWQKLKTINRDNYKNIPPKVHALVQHLVDQFKNYGGIGDFDEQFVERSHQSGKRDLLRSRAIRCRDKKYKSFASWEEIRSNPDVMAMSEAVAKNRKRKIRGVVGVQAQKKMEAEARGIARDTYDSQYVPKDLMTAADLALNELQRQQNTNDNNDI